MHTMLVDFYPVGKKVKMNSSPNSCRLTHRVYCFPTPNSPATPFISLKPLWLFNPQQWNKPLTPAERHLLPLFRGRVKHNPSQMNHILSFAPVFTSSYLFAVKMAACFSASLKSPWIKCSTVQEHYRDNKSEVTCRLETLWRLEHHVTM